MKKKDGTYRYCIDVKDALDSLRGARYFATIDLLSGYWQIPLTQEARARSAFCTRRGSFEFTTMRFGLSNAPATFCRRMQLVFKDMLHKCCFAYLDDIIDFAYTIEELIERLDVVFTRL